MVYPQLNNHNKVAMDGALVGVGSHNWGGLDWMKLLCIYCTWMTFSYLHCPHWFKGAKVEVVKIEFWKSLGIGR